MNLQVLALAICTLLQEGFTIKLENLDPSNILNYTKHDFSLEKIKKSTNNSFQEIFGNSDDLSKYDLFKNVKTFTELANETGLRVSEHKITTSDGYILGTFHIESNGTNGPVLLIHGLIDSSDTFIIRRKSSLTKVLVDAGYDVWLMNIRGNKYSQQHVSKNPDKDQDYWDFSFHEMATEDLPAVIDYILCKTDKDSLHLIGHSQGAQIIVVLASEKPEYNDKIKSAITLAPSCFLQNVYKSSFQILFDLAPFWSLLLEIFGGKQLFADTGVIRKVEQIVCSIDDLGYDICLNNIINSIMGADNDQIEPSFFKEYIVNQYPTSTSVKNLLHVAQLNQLKRFAKFDFGIAENLIKYSSLTPPEYDLSKVTTKVFTFEGKNDVIGTFKDTDLLAAKLSNIKRTTVERAEMNHVDFVYGRDAHIYLYPDVLKAMKENQ